MKNISKVLAVAAIAAASVSCQKAVENGNANQENNGGVRIVVRASEAWSPDGAEATKTHMDADYNVIWDSDETMKLFCAPSAEETPVSAVSESAEVSSDGKTADFSFTLSGIEGWENFIYGGVYPASAVDGSAASDVLSSVKVILPSSQTPTTAAYDPAAYIMVAKPQTFTGAQTSIAQWFRRAVALNKFTLSGLSFASGEKVSSVTFTLPEGKAIAGGRRINLATGESGVYEGGVSALTLDYAEPFTVSDGSFDAWFTSWSFELAAGESVSVKVVTDRAEYVRSVTVPVAVPFLEGKYNTLTVKMDAAVKTVTDPSAVAEDNLVAYFPFDTDGADKIGSLTPKASPNVTFPSGQRGGALQGADNGYLLYDLPTASPLRDLKAFAVAFWLKQAAIPSSQAPVPIYFSISKDSDKYWGNLTLTSERLDQNYLYFKVYFRKEGVDWAGQTIPVSNSAFTAGVWKHYVFQYDNVKSEFRIYVDGVCPFTDTSIINRYSNGSGVALGDLCFNGATQFVIGGWLPKILDNATDDWMGWFTGGIDEMRIYDRALTADEVSDLYGAELRSLDK